MTPLFEFLSESPYNTSTPDLEPDTPNVVFEAWGYFYRELERRFHRAIGGCNVSNVLHSEIMK